MFPTLSEAITGERLTVGPPFFNKWMTPIGLALLFLTGVGPLLAWRKSTLIEPARPVPVAGRLASLVTAVALDRARRARLGLRASASRCARSSPARSRQEFVRGASVRQQGHRHRPVHGARRPRRRDQAALRRLHRAPRHRADLPRLRRRGLQAGGAGAAEAGPAGRRSASSRSRHDGAARSPTTARSRWSRRT